MFYIWLVMFKLLHHYLFIYFLPLFITWNRSLMCHNLNAYNVHYRKFHSEILKEL